MIQGVIIWYVFN